MKYLFVMALLLPGVQSQAQKLLTRNGNAHFLSEAKLENIEAKTNQVTVLVNTQTNAVAVKIPVSTFRFEKALMEEHFNENYLETEKFPEATFSGKFIEAVDWTKTGKQTLTVEGELTIHGVKKKVKEQVVVEIKDGKIAMRCDFTVALADYSIKNDKLENIANSIKVQVDATFDKP